MGGIEIKALRWCYKHLWCSYLFQIAIQKQARLKASQYNVPWMLHLQLASEAKMRKVEIRAIRVDANSSNWKSCVALLVSFIFPSFTPITISSPQFLFHRTNYSFLIFLILLAMLFASCDHNLITLYKIEFHMFGTHNYPYLGPFANFEFVHLVEIFINM